MPGIAGSAAAPYFFQGPAGFGQGLNAATSGFLSRIVENERERIAREDRARTIGWATEDRIRALADREHDALVAKTLAQQAGIDPATLPPGATSAQVALLLPGAKETRANTAYSDYLKSTEGADPTGGAGYLSKGLGVPFPAPDGQGPAYDPTASAPADLPMGGGFLTPFVDNRVRDAKTKLVSTLGPDAAAKMEQQARESRTFAHTESQWPAQDEAARLGLDVTKQGLAQGAETFAHGKSQWGTQDEAARTQVDIAKEGLKQAREINPVLLEEARSRLYATDVATDVHEATLAKLQREAEESKGKFQVFYDPSEIKAGKMGPPHRYGLTEDPGNIPANLISEKAAFDLLREKGDLEQTRQIHAGAGGDKSPASVKVFKFLTETLRMDPKTAQKMAFKNPDQMDDATKLAIRSIMAFDPSAPDAADQIRNLQGVFRGLSAEPMPAPGPAGKTPPPVDAATARRVAPATAHLSKAKTREEALARGKDLLRQGWTPADLDAAAQAAGW